MVLIGLGNKARQGKDFVANYMKEAYPGIKLYSFAAQLKLYCKEHHDQLLSQWQLAHQTKQIPAIKEDPIYGCTSILQWFGTDIARRQNPNIWVDILRTNIKSDWPAIAIITDVRFPNEAEFVKENDGYMVEVIRVREDGTRYLDSSRDPKHTSECALDEYPYDFVIRVKDGALDILKQKAIGVLNNVLRQTTSLDRPLASDYNCGARLGDLSSGA